MGEPAPSLRTSRLVLRRWQAADRALFAELNSDAQVMEFFPARLTAAESDAQAARIEEHWVEHGFGLWALELAHRPGLIGFAGLSRVTFEAPFAPCVEVAWRLAREHWGNGYATEAARSTIEHGFRALGLSEIVSFTSVHNWRSRRVMEKLGMRRAEHEDFDHPRLPLSHPLCRHVLYRLSAEPVAQ